MYPGSNSFFRIFHKQLSFLIVYLHTQATITKNHLVVREQCPLRMLPPPLNIVPTVLSPLHYLLLHSYGISLGGTVCNVILRCCLVYPASMQLTGAAKVSVVSVSFLEMDDQIAVDVPRLSFYGI